MSSTTAAYAARSAVAPKPGSDAGALRINRPDDLFEQEAVRAAEQVMSGRGRPLSWSLARVGITTRLQRQCTCGGQCEACTKNKEHRTLQRDASAGSAPAVAPPSVHRVLRGSGDPLDHATRDFMGSRFGHDFSGVRVFHDAVAAQSARAISAHAYTVGHRIVFGAGKYAPTSNVGRRLLAHELSHVVQQARSDRLLQRDASGTNQQEEDTSSNSVLAQAFRAADARRWEEAARLANGLSPYELKVFLGQYNKPEWLSYLHQGALNAPGVGNSSAIAIATEKSFRAVKTQEQARYADQLAKQNDTAPSAKDRIAARSASLAQIHKKREESWEVAKKGMWNAAVDIAVPAWLPDSTKEPLKYSEPAPTGDALRDAELKEDYEGGQLVTNVVAAAATMLPVAETAEAAQLAGGKLPKPSGGLGIIAQDFTTASEAWAAELKTMSPAKVSPIRSSPAPIYGKPQVTGPGHAETMERVANELSHIPDAAEVSMNRQMRTATGGVVPTANRPDNVLLSQSGGVTAVEVPSGADVRSANAFGRLIARNLKALRTIPGQNEGLFIIWKD